MTTHAEPPNPVPPPETSPDASPEAPRDALAPAAAPKALADAAAPRPGYERTLETLAAAWLRERRSERRWRLFFRLSWLGIAVALVWALYGRMAALDRPAGPHTALVQLSGNLDVDAPASAELLVSALRNAFEDEQAQAVVLRINSPGGSPVQAGIVNDEIQRLKALHHKKVYAVVEEMCTSGAYYVAVAADEIFVDKASVIGSIGVLLDNFGFNALMQRYGVERRIVSAGRHKAMLDPYLPEQAGERALAQSMVDQIHQQFIAVVREGRGQRLKETPQTFSGLIWNGEEAVRLGLADRFGSIDFVAREVVKADDIVDYTVYGGGWAEQIARRIGASFGAGVVRALAPPRALR